MRNIFLWVLNRFVFGRGEKIRIDRDNLPGLKAPTAAPSLPQLKKVAKEYDTESISKAYARFKSTPRPKPKKPNGKSEGLF